MTDSLKSTYESLLGLIAQSADIEMPSIHDIAKQFRVRRETIMKAMKMLQDEGFIRIRNRQPALILRSNTIAPDLSISTSSRKLVDTVKSHIMHGDLQPGQRLPKYSYYASEYHISQNSVRDAIKALHEDGIISRKGKGWIVGTRQPKQKSQLVEVVGSRGVVLVIYRNSQHWRDDLKFVDNQQTLLISTAMEDLENSGIQIRQVFREKSSLTAMLPSLATVPRIDTLLEELGDKYRGAMVSVEEWEDAKPLVMRLARTKMPVACFHHLPPSVDPFKGTRVTFFQPNRAAGVALALKSLTDNGHQVIGHPVFPYEELSGEERWMKIRTEQILEEANNLRPSPRIIARKMEESFWLDDRWKFDEDDFSVYIEDLLKKEHEKENAGFGVRRVRPRREMLHKIAPSLAKLVQEPGLTAIIAHNDRMARLYMICLLASGIDVPQEISVISFDNDTPSRLWSQTAVDFGLKPLGHQMARELMGDSKMRLSSRPILHAKPRLILRNSLKKLRQ